MSIKENFRWRTLKLSNTTWPRSLQALSMQEVRISMWSQAFWAFWAGSSVFPPEELSENTVAFLGHYQVCHQSNTHTARTKNLDVLGEMSDLRRNSTRIWSWEEGGNRSEATAVAQTSGSGRPCWGRHMAAVTSRTAVSDSWSCHAERDLTAVMEPECSRTTEFSMLYNFKCRGIWEMRV